MGGGDGDRGIGPPGGEYDPRNPSAHRGPAAADLDVLTPGDIPTVTSGSRGDDERYEVSFFEMSKV